MSDYIPETDEDFDPYLRIKFGPYFNTNFAALGFVAADNTTLQGALTNWGYSWTAFTNAVAAVDSATMDKDAKRPLAETAIRRLAMKIQSNPAITDAQKAALGVTVRKT